jgi:hypothetical protein
VVDGTVVPSAPYSVLSPGSGVWRSSRALTSNIDSGQVLGKVDGLAVSAPAAGQLLSEIADGVRVVPGIPVAQVSYTGFAVQMKVPSGQLYRLYATPTTALVAVAHGPAGITCTVASPPPQSENVDADKNIDALCLLPLDAKVVGGLTAKVGLKTASKTNVLALPVSAVLGSTESGLVTVIDGGKRTLRKVGLGITDGAYVEVTDGLTVNQEVLASAPTSPDG